MFCTTPQGHAKMRLAPEGEAIVHQRLSEMVLFVSEHRTRNMWQITSIVAAQTPCELQRDQVYPSQLEHHFVFYTTLKRRLPVTIRF